MATYGIQNDYERQRIEYAPVIKYTKEPINSINNVVIPPNYGKNEDVQDFITHLPSNVLRRVVNARKAIDDTIQRIEQSLADKPAKIPEHMKDAMLEAGTELGIDLSNGIDYSTYRDLYNDPLNSQYEKQLILDAWESYQRDMDGSVEGEYYTDLLELKKDITSTTDFVKRALLQHIHYNVAFDMEDPLACLDDFEVVERDFLNTIISMKYEINEIEAEIQQYLIKTMDPRDPENMKHDAAISKYNNLVSQYETLVRKANVLSEIGAVVDSKVNSTLYIVELIDRYSRYTPQNAYDGNMAAALEPVVSDSVSNLYRVQTLLRYSFDQQNQQIVEEKKKCDSALNTNIKQAAQDIIVRNAGVKIGVVHPLIKALSNIPLDQAKYMEVIGESIVNGIECAEREYKNNIVQLYGVNEAYFNAEVSRIKQIDDKRKIRDYYNALSAIISEAQNVGIASGSKSQWINGVLSNIGMNHIYDDSTGKKVPI